MRELECVRMENTSTILDTYLKSLIKNIGLEISFIDWKKQTINSNGPLIVILDHQHLSIVKTLIDNRDEKIIIALNSRKDFKLVAELKKYLPKIFGFIDLSQEIDYNTPILNNYLNMNFSTQAVGLNKLANDLEKIYEFTKSELTRVKDLHTRFVKVRTDQLKGATFVSKFMTGESSGGEFFEIIQNEHEVYFILAGSNSYILSSQILGEFENLKVQAAGVGLKTLTSNLTKKITQLAHESKAELTYCLLHLNLKTLQANFSSLGPGYIFYGGELISFNQALDIHIKPNERFGILSQGAIKNWEALPQLPIKKFFTDHQNMETSELINEFFFEVSRNKAGNFLIYDAFFAMVEINENLLYQLS